MFHFITNSAYHYAYYKVKVLTFNAYYVYNFYIFKVYPAFTLYVEESKSNEKFICSIKNYPLNSEG